MIITPAAIIMLVTVIKVMNNGIFAIATTINVIESLL